MNEKRGKVVLEARDVQKSFHQGPREVRVLEKVSLSLSAGESLAIIGASGAGKSTLLHILGGLDQPDSGEVMVEGASMWKLGASERSKIRNKTMGFVYQFHHLLPEFTALENVAMPLLIRGESTASAQQSALDILGRVGDEPTGNLDERTADHVYGMMLELNQELHTSLLLVTHDKGLAARMDRQLELHMGCLQQLG